MTDGRRRQLRQMVVRAASIDQTWASLPPHACLPRASNPHNCQLAFPLSSSLLLPFRNTDNIIREIQLIYIKKYFFASILIPSTGLKPSQTHFSPSYKNIQFQPIVWSCSQNHFGRDKTSFAMQKEQWQFKGWKEFLRKVHPDIIYWNLLEPIEPIKLHKSHGNRKLWRWKKENSVCIFRKQEHVLHFCFTFLDFITPLSPTCQVSNYALDWCLARFQNCANVRLRWSGQKCKQTSSQAARSKRSKISNSKLPGTGRSWNISVSWID